MGAEGIILGKSLISNLLRACAIVQWLRLNLHQNLPLSDRPGWPVEEIDCCHVISSGSATSFQRPSWWYLHSLVAEVQFSEQRRCCAEETKRLGLSDLFSGRASCSLIRISNCGAVWESWGCSVTNTSCVSVPNQFPVVKADDTHVSWSRFFLWQKKAKKNALGDLSRMSC